MYKTPAVSHRLVQDERDPLLLVLHQGVRETAAQSQVHAGVIVGDAGYLERGTALVFLYPKNS